MSRFAWLAFVIACSPVEPRPGPTVEPRPGPTVEPRPGPTEHRSPAAASPDASNDVGTSGDAMTCVATCVAARQMKATSIENIERECEADCRAGKPPTR